MLTDDDLKEMESTARKASARGQVCCLLHSDCAENVVTLVREVRRLRKRDQAVTDALALLSTRAHEND